MIPITKPEHLPIKLDALDVIDTYITVTIMKTIAVKAVLQLEQSKSQPL